MIFLINLDAATDRRLAMQAQLALTRSTRGPRRECRLGDAYYDAMSRLF